jgi:phosphoribosylformylglycinamidine cyclo-ligase
LAHGVAYVTFPAMTARDRERLSYRTSGVDIDAGDALVERIKPLVRATMRPEVLGDLGGFAGLCRIPGRYREPVLVSGTDGVGTKLKIAFATGRHDTVGIDLVAMCVNDVATTGAEPLFFLDYFATGRLDVGVAEAVIGGIAQGCRQAGCALVGGETAEMPGMYADGEYDLAGFAVGVVERDRILDGSRIMVGDQVVGLASSGVHSNGYSLVRKALLEQAGVPLAEVADELLKPTRIYVRAVQAAIAACDVRGAAHITGGGLIENPPRVLRHDLAIRLEAGSWPVPPIFGRIQQAGNVAPEEMRRTFNMGLGLLLVVARGGADACMAACAMAGETPFLVGEVVAGSGEPHVLFAEGAP